MDAFDHVNHSVYLTYLEECRDRLVEAFGDGAIDRFVIRRLEVDYMSQLRQADGAVDTACSVVGVGTTSVRTAEEVHACSDGRLVALATCVLVHLDTDRAVPEPLPAELRARLEPPA